MTCEHCVASVREELTGIEGVTGVDVDLGTGRVDVHTADGAQVTDDDVVAAVREAGYEVA